MINKLLISFNRNNDLGNKADFNEKLGNIGLGLLRIGFGKTITVEKISGGASNIAFTEKAYSTSVKVAAVVLFIFAFPVTILLAGIGYMGMARSKSHTRILNSYYRHHKNAHPIIRFNTPEDKNAITIQKHFRGYLARKAHLPSNSYLQYHVQCEKVEGPESHSMPQAEAGNTKVYLPKDMPGVVLKHSGREAAVKRFHQMQEIRSILHSQKSSHLIIPKANLCGDFLVEERLPIKVDSYHNMGLYLSHPELFDEAVRELTRLFSKVYVKDLVDYNRYPLGHIVGDDVRYDNLPLYVVEENGKKTGKIGLIDLEYTQKNPDPQGLETLVRIFPFHLDVIRKEANALKMEINECSLCSSAENGKKYLQVGFTDHLNWLKQKSVSTNISSQPFQVSSQRLEKLTSILKQELLNLNKGVNPLFDIKGYYLEPKKNFFIGASEDVANELARSITPLIIKNITTQLEKHQEAQLNKIQVADMTESQLVSLRAPYIKRLKLREGVAELILKNPKIVFKENKFHEENEIAEQLTNVLMEELVKGGDIFSFDPAYYTLGAEICWIRY